VSDLFKRHRPRLTEDEDRELFERVRARLRPAARPAPWWRALLAVPAVRYGAPALAVALVGVVWVMQQAPEPPAREQAALRTAPAAEVAVPEAGAPSSPTADPGPDAGAPERSDPPVFAKLPETKSEAPPAEVESRAAGNEVLAQRADEPAADAVRDEAGSRTRMAAAPAPVAAKERAGAGASVGAAQSSGDASLRTLREEGFALSAPDGSAERLAAVLAPAAGEALLETVRLPFSGGTAWIATGLRLEGTLATDAASEMLLAVPGAPTAQAPGYRVTIQAGESRVAVIAVSGEGAAHFVELDGRERAMPEPRASARARRAALGIELLIAQRRGDRAALLRVRDEAARLAAAQPRDAGARALAAWSVEVVGFGGGASYR
jgi:hypothetical protein